MARKKKLRWLNSMLGDASNIKDADSVVAVLVDAEANVVAPLSTEEQDTCIKFTPIQGNQKEFWQLVEEEELTCLDGFNEAVVGWAEFPYGDRTVYAYGEFVNILSSYFDSSDKDEPKSVRVNELVRSMTQLEEFGPKLAILVDGR